MNRTRIDWAQRSWNPIQGCSNKCGLADTGRIWCYAYDNWRRFHLRKDGTQHPGYADDFFMPQLFPDRLDEPARIKNPTMIFTCSMADLFDPLVADEWRFCIFDAMCAAPDHTYIILTKQIERLEELAHSGLLNVPPRCIMGLSITNEDPWISAELEMLCDLRIPLPAIKVCVSAEPLLGPLPNLAAHMTQPGRANPIPTSIDWLIIGAQTGPRAVKPDPAWIVDLVDAADAAHIPVWTKDNLRGICPSSHWRRQRPISPSSSASYRTPRSSASSSSEGGSHSSSKELLP